MRTRVLSIDRRLVLGVAAFVAVEHLVLAQRLPGDSWAQHPRSPQWAMIATATVLLMLVVRQVSVGCWLIAGGAAANVLSWWEHRSVPDYMGVVVADRWIAFNLADAAIVAGALIVAAGAAARAEARIRGRASR